jgi:hypothetical protein
MFHAGMIRHVSIHGTDVVFISGTDVVFIFGMTRHVLPYSSSPEWECRPYIIYNNINPIFDQQIPIEERMVLPSS